VLVLLIAGLAALLTTLLVALMVALILLTCLALLLTGLLARLGLVLLVGLVVSARLVVLIGHILSSKGSVVPALLEPVPDAIVPVEHRGSQGFFVYFLTLAHSPTCPVSQPQQRVCLIRRELAHRIAPTKTESPVGG
jgi:hypothetical protein